MCVGAWGADKEEVQTKTDDMDEPHADEVDDELIDDEANSQDDEFRAESA